MARFLHIADIHLGFDRYDSKERTQDFFYAFKDALEKYAIAPQVDFVLLVGDVFEHRTIQPSTLNQAQICLEMLKEVGIPVLAIEGNHDNRPYGVKTNWLRYLADWELLMLLEPGDVMAGEPFYQPWNAEERRGGYVDLPCGVRVMGSVWYGASAVKAIEQIATEIQTLPPGPDHTVLMFHHGLEGQIARYSGALSYNDVLPLKKAGVDYLALGHIHKAYSVEGWIFNPGAIEANSVDESRFDRGVYLVEMDAAGIRAELKRDYRQRPIVRLEYRTKGQEQLDDVEAGAMATIEHAIQTGRLHPKQAPIVELKIEGQVGFDRLDLDVRRLQQRLQEVSGSLIFLLKYDVDEVAYGSPLGDGSDRLQIEREVFTDLLTANTVYKKRAGELAQGLIDLKELQLEGRSEADLYEFVASLIGNRGEST